MAKLIQSKDCHSGHFVRFVSACGQRHHRLHVVELSDPEWFVRGLLLGKNGCAECRAASQPAILESMGGRFPLPEEALQ